LEYIYRSLQDLEKKGEYVKVGLVGAGQMGSGLVSVAAQMPGFRIVAVADLEIERGIRAYQESGIDENQIVVTEDPVYAEKAIVRKKVVVTKEAKIISHIPSIEAVVEGTGLPTTGAEIALSCILSKKHIIMLNVETDVVVGLILKKLADNAGIVYTVSAGDEPGVIKELYNFARTLGFTVVTAGKGKNNPINHYANPDDCKAEAEEKDMNPKMLVSFVDGSKTMIEMTEVANATGLIPDIPGMHGPKVDVPDLQKVFVPRKDGGILFHSGVVDYSTGKVAPGVFIVIRTDSHIIRKNLKYYALGEGPYYLLYRPYHLCSIETPLSVARAVLLGEYTVNTERLVAEVVAIAKRDLEPGHVVDGIGGYDVFGKIYVTAEARELQGIPLGLSEGAIVKNRIKKSEPLTQDKVSLNKDTVLFQLWQIQNRFMQDMEITAGCGREE